MINKIRVGDTIVHKNYPDAKWVVSEICVERNLVTSGWVTHISLKNTTGTVETMDWNTFYKMLVASEVDVHTI